MNNEIKEINIPNDILAILGDLTNGAMNYYKNPKVIELKYKLLLDYITNLQKEINKLTAESTEWESKCYDLQKENERLKKENTEYQDEIFARDNNWYDMQD